MRRYHMQNDVNMVEFEFSPSGLEQAKRFRASHREFARRRIRDVLQLKPDEVEIAAIYPWHRRK